MNNEIKEILYNLKMYVNDKYLLEDAIENKEQAKILLDYITNLQSKIEAYELFDNQKITNLQEENERLEKGLEYAKRIEKDYKTKFNKAIEYIENNTLYSED